MASTASAERTSHTCVSIVAPSAAAKSRGLGQHRLPPAADDEVGAKLDVAEADAAPKAGAAPGDEHALAAQQILVEHASSAVVRAA
jgi:hypothetical protein